MKKEKTKKFEQTVPAYKSNSKAKEALTNFLENCNTVRLSKNLRKIFFDYLLHEKDNLPVDFEIYLIDLSMLFELLDSVNIEDKFS